LVKLRGLKIGSDAMGLVEHSAARFSCQFACFAGSNPNQSSRRRAAETKSPRRLLPRAAADTAAATRLRQGFGRGKQHYFFEFSGGNSRMNDQVTSAGVVFVVDM
jgi:hypothetical protein